MFFFDEGYPNPFVSSHLVRGDKNDADYVTYALNDAYAQLREAFVELVPSSGKGNLGFYIEHNAGRSVREAGFVMSDGYKSPYSSYSVYAPFISELGLNTLHMPELSRLFRQFSHHLSTHVFNHPDSESHWSKNPLWMTVLWWGTDVSYKNTKFGYSFKSQDRFNNSGTTSHGSPGSNVHLWAKSLNATQR